jgi:hypothetical protein
MAYPTQRSKNDALREGATDGKYKKTRPDTTLSSDNVAGNHQIVVNKAMLEERDGYASAHLTYPETRVTPNVF